MTTVAYQGEPGSNSWTAAEALYPASSELTCTSFDQALEAVTRGAADVAVIPVDNSAAGRVADVHHLLPESGLLIIAEYFLAIRFDLMGLPGTSLDHVECVRSHVHALGQCRKIIREGGWQGLVSDDTAGAAREVAELGDRRHAALAPPAAASLYGLEVLRAGVEDDPDNTTRFVVLSREGTPTPYTGDPMMTSLFFSVRNIPSSLYKALGGFASSGVNLTKIESYQAGAGLHASRFYAEIEGHPDDPRVELALQELRFFSSEVRILGVYPAHEHRRARSIRRCPGPARRQGDPVPERGEADGRAKPSRPPSDP
ncbi:prephenate dehydratase [Streptomyces parvulus]|uniref:prephenate dehydratase n=1 Tax=Streptomyces parvulus TaxID=146923 RepID=UPI003693D2DA